MGEPGIGVLINMLAGSRGAEYLKEALGKTIAGIKIEGKSELRFAFNDGTAIKIWDSGQTAKPNMASQKSPNFLLSPLVRASSLL